MPYLQLDDRTHIRFETLPGPSGAPWIVFLHEGLGCIEMWRDFPRRLCAAVGCPGLLYDRRGHGRSSPRRERRSVDYLHDHALRELPAVLSLALPGHAYHLFGHSDGGSIALIAAAARPALLVSVVALAAHVFVEPESLSGIRAAVTARSAGKLRGLDRHHGSMTGDLFEAWSATWLSPSFRGWSIERLLPAIEVPVLALQGEHDQYGTARQLDAIARGCARATVSSLPGSGHAPHLDCPDDVVARARDFLCGPEPATGPPQRSR